MSTIPRIVYLNEAQLEKLHRSGVEILQTFGMRIEDPEIRKMLADRGCTVEGDRVKFTDELIDATVKNQKSKVTMTTRNGYAVNFELGKTFSHSTGGAPFISDALTGKRREAKMSDLIDTIKVMNQCDNLTIPCALCYPSDIPSAVTQLEQTAAMLKYSKKPIYGPGLSSATNAKYIAELFKLYCNGDLQENPIGMVGISPESPLFLPKEITDTMRHIIGAGIPTSILSAPVAGYSSPITVIGCIAQCHAEILAFAAVAYLINPKCVLFYGSRTFFPSMRTSQCAMGLPETGISSAICAQLATHLGWMSDVYGLTCSSCAPDEQAGYEKMINGLLPAMAGATLVTGFGSTASVMCCSLAQLVMDDDILGMIYRAQRACEVDEDSLGFDAIDEVINDGEIFLGTEHTVMHSRSEIWLPNVGFDGSWADWTKMGEVPLTELAQKKALDMLKKEAENPADDSLDAEAAKILEAARKELL